MSTSRSVLITGCSTGIGRATAERLAARGHEVYATARRPETVADLAGAGCQTLALDVTDAQRYGRIVNLSSMGGTLTFPGGGAYHATKYAVEAYEKRLLKHLGGGPDAVAAVIEKALTARRPKTRYRVTASAFAMIGQRRLMTDRMWDRFLDTHFPRPGADA